MNQNEWVLIEEYNNFTSLCRKIPGKTKKKDLFEAAAVCCANKWLRERHRILASSCRIIRKVPAEEALAIILSAGSRQ